MERHKVNISKKEILSYGTKNFLNIPNCFAASASKASSLHIEGGKLLIHIRHG